MIPILPTNELGKLQCPLRVESGQTASPLSCLLKQSEKIVSN